MFSSWKGRAKPNIRDNNLSPTNQEQPSSSSPSFPQNLAFGAPIPPSSDGPPMLGKFVRFLQAKGINTEHIFKTFDELETEVQQVKKNVLKELLMTDNEQIQLATYTKNPHVVAELMKQYLASLPEPLLTYPLYDSFLLTQTIRNPSDRVWAYRFLLAYLPPGFRASVKLVLTLLSRIALNVAINHMDSYSLACIFGPYFLRPEEDLYYMKDDQTTIAQIVTLLIDEYEAVLKAAPPQSRAVATVSLPSSLSSVFTPPAPPTETQINASPVPALPLAGILANENQATPSSLPSPLAPINTPPAPSPNENQSNAPNAPFQPQLIPVETHPLQPPIAAPKAQPPPAIPAPSPPTTPVVELRQPQVDSSTLEKLSKLKLSISSLLDMHIQPRLLAIVCTIQTGNYSVAISGSRVLRDAKKLLMDSIAQHFNADKLTIAAYLADHPRPRSEFSASGEGPALDDEEARRKLAELCGAALAAAEQVLDVIHFMCGKLDANELKDVVAVAQIVRSLKTVLETEIPSASSLRNSADLQPLSDISSSSPPRAASDVPPSTSTTSSGEFEQTPTLPPVIPTPFPPSQHEMWLSQFDVVAQDTFAKLSAVNAALEICTQPELVEYARSVRFVKQCLHELFQEQGLEITPDTKPVAPAADQLTILRLTVAMLLEKIYSSVETIQLHLQVVTDPAVLASIVDKVALMNRALNIPKAT